jgi:hypothetical protein
MFRFSTDETFLAILSAAKDRASVLRASGWPEWWSACESGLALTEPERTLAT